MEIINRAERLWKNWNDALKNIEQKKRLSHAFSKECRPFYVGVHSLSGTFSSTEIGTFICSLEDNFCNCEEHMSSYMHGLSNEGIPCSYMYRLAYEAGIMDKSGRLKQVNDSEIFSEEYSIDSFCKLVQIIEQYDEQAQNILRKIIRYNLKRRHYDGKPIPFSAKRRDVKKLIDDGLFCVVEDSLTLFENQREIIRKMDQSGYYYPDYLPKTKAGIIRAKAKYDWCLQHPTDVAKFAYPDNVVLVAAKMMTAGGKLLYEYLDRKFCDMLCTVTIHDDNTVVSRTIQHPSGAIIVDLFNTRVEFPNDIVTSMLNFNGYNRCRNYTEAFEIHKSRRSVYSVTFSRNTPD